MDILEHLPFEMVLEIARHVEQGDLYNLALSCRVLGKAAQEALYNRPGFSPAWSSRHIETESTVPLNVRKDFFLPNIQTF